MPEQHATRTHRPGTPELVAALGPPLLLAVLGLLHPHELDDQTAARWTALHVALLPVFPLLGLAPWLVARRGPRAAGVAVAVLGYVYALFYTALDVLAGIGTGALQRGGEPDGITLLFRAGNGLSLVGVYAYLLASVVAAAVALRLARGRAVPGAVVVVGAAWSFLGSHVYWPVGVLTVLALAVGWGLLLWAVSGYAPRGGDAYPRQRHGSRPDTVPRAGDDALPAA